MWYVSGIVERDASRKCCGFLPQKTRLFVCLFHFFSNVGLLVVNAIIYVAVDMCDEFTFVKRNGRCMRPESARGAKDG